MKKLFLASHFKDVAGILPDLEADLSGKRVTFIPTASIVEKMTSYVNSGRKALEKLGLIIDELELSSASAEEIERKLRENDIIYLTGGNSFFLLQELKRIAADKIIIEEVQAGKLYIGESAGAVVTAKNIEYIEAMDSKKKAENLSDFNGLNLVDFYTLPHYQSFPFAKIVDKIITHHSDLPLSPISNKEVILVTDEKIQKRKG